MPVIEGVESRMFSLSTALFLLLNKDAKYSMDNRINP